MKKLYIAILTAILIPTLMMAQDDAGLRQYYAKAESEYRIGHFDNAIDILSQYVGNYNTVLRISSYRLIALCYLAKDDMENANKYTDLMLKDAPYYNISIDDPERFAEMIRNKMAGKVTISTASQQEESIEEAPVPVTLITEDMIEAIGARTLKDVLIAYVPGMTSVESPNEVNVSMHGVYTAGQEKILIMTNGQRMNARITNKAAPDYSISLEKIKQIEVLRGPASSLYGNVALVAVVNLITKDGSDVNGIEVEAGIGNFGQKQASLLLGKKVMGIDFTVWGSLYTSEGQKRSVSAENTVGTFPHDGYAWVEGYNHFPSYDVGMTCKIGDFSLIFNHRYGKKVPTFADIHTSMGATYDYERYRTVNGQRAGHGMGFTHAGLSYSHAFNNLSLDATAYFDFNTSNQYSIIGDSVSTNVSGTRYSFFQVMNWKEYAAGGTVSMNYRYPDLGRLGRGSLLVGTQVEYICLLSAEGIVAQDYTDVFMYWPNEPVATGHETSYSPFFQLKHSFTPKWIFNSGLRFDIKRRANSKVITSLSPRISLVYLTNDKLNMKINYARSFVDAPYFYRYNESPSYRGSENLEPEYMQTAQFTLSYSPLKSLEYEAVLSYNKLTGLIYRDVDATGSDPRYINAGELETMCVENNISYKKPRFFTNFNLTYQWALHSANYSATRHRIHNVPNWIANLTVNGNILDRRQHEIWLHATGRFYGKQLSPIEGVTIGGTEVTDMENEVPATFVMNAGVRYKYKNVEVGLETYNLLDKEYYQGGSVPRPYIQQGLSTMLSVKYVFK